MIPYLLVFILLLLMSFRYDINEKKEYQNYAYLFVSVLLILLAGLRYRLGVDTTAYMYGFYHTVPSLSNFFYDEEFLSEPIFYLLCSIIKTIGGKFYLVQLIHATFVCAMLFNYFKKHSKYYFTCILFFYIWDFTSCLMETMRASMAVVICLYGNDFFNEKKWVKGFFLYALAFLCHNSSILLLITPLFLFLRFNALGFIVIVTAVFVGKVVQNQLEDNFLLLGLNEEFSNKAVDYLNSDTYNKEHNIFYYIFNIGTYFFYLILSFVYIKYKNNKGLIFLQPLVLLGLMFVCLRDNNEIFYRFVEFYIPYFIMYFVELFIGWCKDSTKLSVGIRISRSMVMFLPLFYFVMIRTSGYIRYFPYASVIERSINTERETDYKKLRTDFSLIINENEY